MSGESFKGVKMIPPGVHFVSYRAASAQGDVSPASAFFTSIQGRGVLVRRWDKREESLDALSDADEVGRPMLTQPRCIEPTICSSRLRCSTASITGPA
jgi:hypothetical protein